MVSAFSNPDMPPLMKPEGMQVNPAMASPYAKIAKALMMQKVSSSLGRMAQPALMGQRIRPQGGGY